MLQTIPCEKTDHTGFIWNWELGFCIELDAATSPLYIHVTLGGLNFVLLKFLIYQSKITGKMFILDNKQLAH